MAQIATQEVGRIYVPNATRFLPGATTGRSGHIGIVSYQKIDGLTGKPEERAWGPGTIVLDGLQNKWRSDELLQAHYATFDDMVEAINRSCRLWTRGIGPNERVANGAKMVGTQFWGVSSGTTGVNATVGLPTRIALSNLSSLAANVAHESLGTNTANVTTNEYTSSGLLRTGAITPTSWSSPGALEGNYSLQVVNTFTSSGGTSTIYGTALMDNTTTTFNMFAEYVFPSVTVNGANSDQIQVSWTING